MEEPAPVLEEFQDDPVLLSVVSPLLEYLPEQAEHRLEALLAVEGLRCFLVFFRHNL